MTTRLWSECLYFEMEDDWSNRAWPTMSHQPNWASSEAFELQLPPRLQVGRGRGGISRARPSGGISQAGAGQGAFSRAGLVPWC